MTYELAAKLKEAGFPQTNGHLIFEARVTLADAPEEKVLGWYEGQTPEEAVANLWIALNPQ